MYTDNELKYHVRTHTGAKPYSCRHCSERFTSCYQLNVHLLESYNEGTFFTCHICQKNFSHNSFVKIQIRRHDGVKPYVCCECPKRFCTLFELKHHQKVHSDVRDFACGFCAKTFIHKHSVLIHVTTCAYKIDLADMLI